MIALALALLATDAAATGTGKIAGKVTLAGLAPKLANLPVTKDLKVCGTSKPDEALEVGTGGGVKNVVVWVVDGPKPGKAASKAKLDQQGCGYSPHVLAAPVGATLEIVNQDPVLHRIKASEGAAKIFSYAMPIKGQTVPTKLKKEGVLKLSCEVHPWMHGWVHVLPTTAFAVSDADGAYTIEGVPPGKHKVKIWQERLGEREDEVEVAAGQTAQHDVSLTPR